MSTGTVRPAPSPHRIDPFAALADDVYRDPWVEVRAERGRSCRRSRDMVRTRHFDVTHEGPVVVLTHRVPPRRIDDDLAGLLADELFDPGWLRGADLFERLFTGIVLTSGPDPHSSWTLFYANTLRRVDTALLEGPRRAAHGTLDDYAPVYDVAERSLAPGTVLELGCCFGFLSLRLAAAGRAVIATDVSGGTVALLDDVAPRLGLALEARVADAAHVPAPDRCVDNVIAIHLLEHLDAAHGRRVLDEALRLARRRVVVAVPLEEEADATWGHVRTFSLDDLEAWGRSTGLAYAVHEAHGAWLVVDQPV